MIVLSQLVWTTNRVLVSDTESEARDIGDECLDREKKAVLQNEKKQSANPKQEISFSMQFGDEISQLEEIRLDQNMEKEVDYDLS